MTTPSTGMLGAIAQATLNDDVFCEDATTSNFEAEIASLCGHEAAAFVISGTMANQLSLRALLHQPPHAVLAEANAHILSFEAGGMAYLSGALAQPVQPSNGLYLRLEDVQRHAVVTDDVHKCPTRVISLEQTSSGTVVPLQELRRIKAWAGSRGIAVHLDGARLWEAVAASGYSVGDFARCCDVLTVDFSKNLGAPMGAMVVGRRELVLRLRRIRKGIGGGLRQAGVLAAAARQALHETFGSGPRDTMGVLAACHQAAARAARQWTSRGGKLLRPVETNIVWLDLKSAHIESREWNEAGKRHGIKLDGKRLVLHHQIGRPAMEKLDAAMAEVTALAARRGARGGGEVALARL